MSNKKLFNQFNISLHLLFWTHFLFIVHLESDDIQHRQNSKDTEPSLRLDQLRPALSVNWKITKTVNQWQKIHSRTLEMSCTGITNVTGRMLRSSKVVSQLKRLSSSAPQAQSMATDDTPALVTSLDISAGLTGKKGWRMSFSGRLH